MSVKTDKKRALIIETARKVFAAKGYREVTMKDIVDAGSFSRGGLYLYFSSVEELFLAVLEEEEKKTDTEIEQEQLQDATNVKMLLWFLKLQKKELLLKKDSLMTAKYEYAFACNEIACNEIACGGSADGPNAGAKKSKASPLKKERKKALLVLQKILERGMESGEFACLDAAYEAENMMLAIDGMKLLACTLGITEKKIDNEFLYMMQRIVIEEE